MITLIHGDNQVVSRNFLTESISRFKTKGAEVVRLNGQSLSAETLLQSLEAPLLFSGQKLVVIEGLLSLRPSKLKDELVSLVASHPEVDQLLWEGKSVSLTNVNKLGRIEVKEFKIALLVFKFLDTLSLVSLHQAAKTEPVELIFYLLHRRLAQLIQAKDDGSSLKGAPWQIGKLKAQAAKYSLAQLVALQGKLLEIDYSIKSGQDDLPLLSQLDLVLAGL